MAGAGATGDPWEFSGEEPSQSLSSRLSERPCLKNTVQSDQRDIKGQPLAFKCTYMCTYMYVCKDYRMAKKGQRAYIQVQEVLKWSDGGRGWG